MTRGRKSLQRYTLEEVQYAVSKRSEDPPVPYKIIAAELGVSDQALSQRVRSYLKGKTIPGRQLDIERKIREERIAATRAAAVEGFKVADLVLVLGCCRKTVYHRLEEAGISTPWSGKIAARRADRDERLRQKFNQGASR